MARLKEHLWGCDGYRIVIRGELMVTIQCHQREQKFVDQIRSIIPNLIHNLFSFFGYLLSLSLNHINLLSFYLA